MAARSTGWLTQEELTAGINLVDEHNGFNKLSRLAILCMVQYCWLVVGRFASNCYKHWAQLLLLRLGG